MDDNLEGLSEGDLVPRAHDNQLMKRRLTEKIGIAARCSYWCRVR